MDLRNPLPFMRHLCCSLTRENRPDHDLDVGLPRILPDVLHAITPIEYGPPSPGHAPAPPVYVTGTCNAAIERKFCLLEVI